MSVKQLFLKKLRHLKLRRLTFFMLMPAVFISLPVFAQTSGSYQISGKITDTSGEPLIGVVAYAKSVQKGTATDFNGNYSLALSGEVKVTFTHIGYKPQTITVNKAGVFNLVMEEDAIGLDELVVIGYGTTTKKDMTGAVTSLKAADVVKGAAVSTADMLVGKAAGLFVVPSEGNPAGGTTLRIRNGSSLSAGNSPMIVVDGIPIAGDANVGQSNVLSFLNPNDIESLTVLKDASATAIYGSRASNGVIIIKTKRAGEGKGIKVGYSSTYSATVNTEQVAVLSPQEFRSYMDEFWPSDTPLGASAHKLMDYTYPATGEKGQFNTNWQDHIYQVGLSTDQNVNITNSGKLPARVSLGFNSTRGTLIGSKFERFTQTLNLSPKFFNNRLSVDLNIRGMQNNNVSVNNVVGSAASYDPTKPIWAYADASHTTLVDFPNQYNQGYWQMRDANGVLSPDGSQNPISNLRANNDNHNYATRLAGNVQLDYSLHFLPDLRAILNMGLDRSWNDDFSGQIVGGYSAWRNGTMNNKYRGIGDYTKSKNTRKNDLIDFYFAYAKDLKSVKSKVDATAGYSWQHFWRDDISPRYSNPYTENGVVVMESELIDESKHSPREYFLISLFGRVNYSLMDKYLLTATIRRDGTSRFSPKNRWGTFPSAALGWRISEEEFLKDIDRLDNLKLRASWGKTGQQDIGTNYYPYIPQYAVSRLTNTVGSNSLYAFGIEGEDDYRVHTLLSPRPYNENIKWETTATTNIGADFAFLHNRVNGSVEYFYKLTTDLINYINIPAGSNFTNKMDSNIGSMNAKGVEVTLDLIPVKTKDFSWEINTNATWIKQEITKLTATYDPEYLGVLTGGISFGTGFNIQVHREGYAPNTFLTFDQVYDQNGYPIQGAFVDQNGDGIIDDKDLVAKHSNRPNVFFGLNMNFRYKQFDLGFNSHGSIDNYLYNEYHANNSTAANVMASGGYLRNTTKYAYYTTRFTNPMDGLQARSNLFLENASFWKLDMITAGYRINKLFNTKMNARLSFTAQNILTMTNYSGTDPEVSSGIAGTAWPRPRLFVLGLNINY